MRMVEHFIFSDLVQNQVVILSIDPMSGRASFTNRYCKEYMGLKIRRPTSMARLCNLL